MPRAHVLMYHQVYGPGSPEPGRLLACQTQWVEWNAKKLAKRAMGPSYYRLRARLLARTGAGDGT